MKKELTVLRHILRIITPGEISDLTKTSNGRKQVSLTHILKVYFDGRSIDEAWDKPVDQDISSKVLPFKQSENLSNNHFNQEKKDFVLTIGKRVVDYLDNFVSEEKNNEGSLFTAKKKKEWKSKSRGLSSEFILTEIRKYKKSNQKLKLKNSEGLYEKTSLVDESDIKGDLGSSDTVGNLVNKKSA